MAYSFYDAMLSEEPLQLVMKYSVSPCSGLAEYPPSTYALENGKLKELKAFPVGVTNLEAPSIYDEGAFDSFSSAMVDPAKRVCYAHLTNGVGSTRGGLRMDASVKGHENWVPIYFLPWGSKKICSLEIPDKPEDAKDHPRVFFTAALSGCSIFVRGTPAHPTVYHAGIDSSKDGKLPYAAPSFWRDFLMYVSRKEGHPLNPGDFGEVNTTDYINQFLAEKGSEKTTLRAELYKDWLKQTHRKELSIEDVSPWGCVFGIRTGKLWKFYLQENASVTFTEFRKVKKKVVIGKKFFGLKKITKEVEEQVKLAARTLARPMVIREFFPGGSGVATSKPTQRLV
jgi:hypothetical protein